MQNDRPSMIHVIEPSQILVYHQHGDYKNINVIQLIYRKLWFFGAIVALGMLIAGGVGFKLKPQYKVVTYLAEPHMSQYEELYRNTRSMLSANELFNIFLIKLSNPKNFDLFKKSLKSSTINKKYKFELNQLRFNVLINRNTKLTNASNFTKLAYDGLNAEFSIVSPNANLSADLAKSYIDFTNKETLNDSANAQRESISIYKKELERKIDFQFRAQQNIKQFEIENLKSRIALIPKEHGSAKLLERMNAELKVKEYELGVITNRDKFSDYNIEAYQLELQYLNNLSFKISHVDSFHIDSQPKTIALKRNFKLMLMAGALLGFIFALFIVLLRTIFTVRKELELPIATHNEFRWVKEPNAIHTQ